MKRLLFCLLLSIPLMASGQTVAVYISGNAAVVPVAAWVLKSASDTITNVETKIKANAAAGNINLVLPSPTTCAGLEFVIKKVDPSTHTVTLVGTIDGVTNYVIHTPNQSITVSSDGTSFLIL